jgi:mannosyltransferase OCH1-like enzyme
MKIPKIIHYCWFGPKPMPELELKCIESWQLFLPRYKLMFWNEETFNINQHEFAKQAYENKYYAFVSDLVRTQVLFEYGGIYLDTDLEVFSGFEKLIMNDEVILGFENKSFIGTAMMASIPNHKIFLDFANYYRDLSFISKKGDVQITANPSILAEILKQYDIVFNGKEQFASGIHIYSRDYFYPKKIKNGQFRITDNTVSIHHFEGSWLSERQKKRGQNIFWIEIIRPVLRSAMILLSNLISKDKTKLVENKIRNLLK